MASITTNTSSVSVLEALRKLMDQINDEEDAQGEVLQEILIAIKEITD